MGGRKASPLRWWGIICWFLGFVVSFAVGGIIYENGWFDWVCRYVLMRIINGYWAGVSHRPYDYASFITYFAVKKMMVVRKNICIDGSVGKSIWLDVFAPSLSGMTGDFCTLIYAHGFCGFKDWGNFDLIAIQFANAGFVFVKFNFSHNGMSNGNTDVFDDLEAFGQNNYSKQLADLRIVTDWVSSELPSLLNNCRTKRLGLIGHSMGGAVSILHACNDSRIERLVTWAATSACKTPWGNWTEDALVQWKHNGVAYYRNGRTKQDMPLYYQLHEDFLQHESAFDVTQAISQLSIPVLLCHGSNDTSVTIAQAALLHNSLPTSKLFVLPSDHVFGRSHPWVGNDLPTATQALVKETIQFFS